MTGDFGLLGDPIPETWGKRGRPPHRPTENNRNKIRLLLAGVDQHPHRPGAQDQRRDAKEVLISPTPFSRST